MKRSILRKLKSNEGASLTFALLLFLICAVIGTIVLTAGSVASGRLADKAEMDQRYYNVVSTAEFLNDVLDGKTVTIVRTKGSGSTATIEVGEYTEDNQKISDFLSLRTIELLDSDAFDADFYSTVAKINEFEFQVADNIMTIDMISTVVDGKMILDISDNDYTVRMILVPVIREVDSRNDDNVQIKTAVITWHVNNIEKVFG